MNQWKKLWVFNMLDYFGMKPKSSRSIWVMDIMIYLCLGQNGLILPWGNARAELKEKADYITTDCDKDGIYNACKHFKWID